jgi:prefoldin subunit 5
MDLKAEAGRLQRRVADVTKSREKWRRESEALRQRVQQLEAQTVALQEHAAAFKKDRPESGPRPR